MTKTKMVQIPIETFAALCRYHLLDIYTDSSINDVKSVLEAKLDALAKHDTYSLYKQAKTPLERDEARLDYLNKIGAVTDFII
jgi:hypothetical protein